jgi:molybdopterin/thiamine biosynthesis adenylyltransferase
MSQAKIDTTRQSGLIPDDAVADLTVAVVGCGAIGSHTTEALTKMGVRKIRVFDDDTVDYHNLSNQGYYWDNIGYKKVEALSSRLSEGTGAELIGEYSRVDSDHVFQEKFVVSAVDNMKGRKEIFDSFMNSPTSRYLLDGRMGAMVGQAYFVDKVDIESIERYEKTLFSDEEAYQAPCTEKSTIFCAYGLSAVLCALVAQVLMGRRIEYMAEIDFSNMYMIRNT